MRKRRIPIFSEESEIGPQTFDIYSAIRDSQYNVLNGLLQHAPTLVNKPEESTNLSPLIIAVKTGDVTIVRLFLSFCANVCYKDGKGNTALHFVKDHNIMMLLLHNGGNRFEKNNDGNTPLKTINKKCQNLLNYLNDYRTMTIFEALYTRNEDRMKFLLEDGGFLATHTDNKGDNLMQLYLDMMTRKKKKGTKEDRQFIEFMLSYNANRVVQ